MKITKIRNQLISNSTVGRTIDTAEHVGKVQVVINVVVMVEPECCVNPQPTPQNQSLHNQTKTLTENTNQTMNTNEIPMK
jgi:hypothetical protein